jgi:hypothetical protein
MTAVSRYVPWNDSIAARFFRPEAAGQPVYLFVTEDVIDEVGRSVGGGLPDFIAAVLEGPPGMTRSGLCQRALQVADRWSSRNTTYPPYLAYLALFVLAGGHDGDFDPRSYYPRLWELLGEPDAGTPPSFDRMLELWDDLEHWSLRDRGGELGVFKAAVVGGKIHIGLPLAQTVLTEAERRALPCIFASAGLDPDSHPSDRELRRAMAIHGRQALRPRTISALEKESSAFASALLDVVAEDFLNWDGESEAQSTGLSSTPHVHAGLRLCISLDRVAGTARVSARCRARKALPDSGLVFTATDDDGPLTCTEFVPGWSSPLARTETGTTFVPPISAWTQGLALRAAEWTAQSRPARLRAFIDGTADALPGLVEVLELPRRRPFFLAYQEEAWPTMQGWADSGCRGFKRLSLKSGLPPGWAIASVEEAITDAGTQAVDPELGFPSRHNLRLIGGIRAAAGNTFFIFAPPRVTLDGAEPGDVVLCNGSPLTETASTPGTYILPEDTRADSRIGLEARHGEDVIKRTSLYLISGFGWQLDAPVVAFDRCGRPAPGIEGIAGAAVPEPAAPPFPVDLLRTPGLSPHAHRVYFIGRGRGQITAWPKEPLPEWDPVWAVPFAARGRALYCGASLDMAEPLTQGRANRRHVELQRSVLWRKRAKVTPPQDRDLKALWQRYREAARDA